MAAPRLTVTTGGLWRAKGFGCTPATQTPDDCISLCKLLKNAKIENISLENSGFSQNILFFIFLLRKVGSIRIANESKLKDNIFQLRYTPFLELEGSWASSPQPT